MTPLMKFRRVTLPGVLVGVSSVMLVSPGWKESFTVRSTGRQRAKIQDTAKLVQIQRLLAGNLDSASDGLLERERPLDVRRLHHQVENARIFLDLGHIVTHAPLVNGNKQSPPADCAVERQPERALSGWTLLPGLPPDAHCATVVG